MRKEDLKQVVDCMAEIDANTIDFRFDTHEPSEFSYFSNNPGIYPKEIGN